MSERRNRQRPNFTPKTIRPIIPYRRHTLRNSLRGRHRTLSLQHDVPTVVIESDGRNVSAQYGIIISIESRSDRRYPISLQIRGFVVILGKSELHLRRLSSVAPIHRETCLKSFQGQSNWPIERQYGSSGRIFV